MATYVQTIFQSAESNPSFYNVITIYGNFRAKPSYAYNGTVHIFKKRNDDEAFTEPGRLNYCEGEKNRGEKKISTSKLVANYFEKHGLMMWGCAQYYSGSGNRSVDFLY